MSQRGRRASHGSHPEHADQNMRARHLWKSLDNNDLNQVSEPSGFHENMGLVGDAHSCSLTNLGIFDIYAVCNAY